VALAGLAVMTSAAVATVSIARAELSGNGLRLEGRGLANHTITVDGVAMGTSDGAGNFRIERQPFSAPADCTVDVNDGSASPTAARLSGCTVAAPPPPPPPPPSGATPPTSLSLSHSSLDQVGTLAVAGVTFAPNPPTPLDFAVQSSHPNNAQVPASVHVEQFSDPGNPVASFTVTYLAEVSAPTPVTISVSAAGVTKTAVLTLNPTPAPTLGGGERGPGFVGADFTTFATKGTTIFLGPNGVGPLRADIIAGKLPDGLRLVQPGCATPAKCPYVAIVGTPTRVQTSTFTVRATDARGQQATGTFTITINPALPLAITSQQWAPVTVGSFSNLWIDGSGGVRPYRWARTAGQLPPGMALIQDNPSGPLVRVGGTPTAAGTFAFTLRLTDATGATVTRTFSVTVS
jgi:Putative Ig domain